MNIIIYFYTYDSWLFYTYTPWDLYLVVSDEDATCAPGVKCFFIHYSSYMETKGFRPNKSTPKNEVVLRTIIIMDFFGGFNESQYFICYFVE